MNIYLLLKLIHILAVIVFLGNIYTGLFWMSLATKSKNVLLIEHSMKGIIKSDRWFTIPGVIIITAGGMASATYGGIPMLKTGWIFWPIVLFTVSGIAFVWKVAPLQKKIHRLSVTGSDNENFWEDYARLNKAWEIWGGIALITPLIALVMMVLKIPAVSFF